MSCGLFRCDDLLRRGSKRVLCVKMPTKGGGREAVLGNDATVARRWRKRKRVCGYKKPSRGKCVRV
jgi:hypothetical protein